MAPSSSSSASSASRGRGKGFALVAAVYLLGLFIGALDTGIVTPARTVIQSDLGIGEQMGVGGDDSWGANVHPEYIPDVTKPVEFTFTFRGI